MTSGTENYLCDISWFFCISNNGWMASLRVTGSNYSFSSNTPVISLTYLGSFLYCNLPFPVDDLDNLFLHAKETDCRKSDVFSVFQFRNLCHTQSKKTTLPMLHLEARLLRESIHASTQRTVGFDVLFFPWEQSSQFVCFNSCSSLWWSDSWQISLSGKKKKHFSHQKNKNPLDQIRLRSNISLHLYRPWLKDQNCHF